MKRLLTAAFLLATLCTAGATTRYVTLHGNDDNTGTTPEQAKADIRVAIDEAYAGDTIRIAAGIYHESFILKDGVHIIGDDGAILDGTSQMTRLITTEEDCRLHTTIENLVLQNARHNQRGGAALLRGKVVMRNCTIRGCSGVQCGGVLIEGEAAEASALGARIEHCLIHNCSATGHYWPDAGGVANFNGTVDHCTICNNYGDRYGGIHSESTVKHTVMWGNRSEYGFVDPANYVSDESLSPYGTNRADEGFEAHFFTEPWLSADNEAAEGPHFRDPATFAGVPVTAAEQAIMLAADYSTGEPTHRIATMPPATERSYMPKETVTFPYELKAGDKTYRSDDYTVPSFIGRLLSDTATLVGKEEPYCMVANINGDPRSRMAFCWFTNEGVREGKVQLLRKADATAEDFESGEGVITIEADTKTTPPLHYAISTSGILKAARLDKNTAFHYESHKAVAEHLQPGSTYSWRVGYESHWSGIARFRTEDKKQKDFSFIYMTDSHIQNREYVDDARRCAEAVARNEKDARFCVFPGDFVDTGTEKNSEWEWERWFEEALRPVIMQMPIVPTDGNHDDTPLLNYTYHFNTDSSFNTEAEVKPQFAGITYSFVYGDMLLLAYSMQDFWHGAYSYDSLTSTYFSRDVGGWFRRQVAANPKTRYRVALVHKNLFSGSDHQRDKETPLMRATLLPVFKECEIDLVLQGHDHTYEEIGPVDPDTRTPIRSAISGQETVAADPVKNITGKRGGTYDVSDGTMYFIGATCGTKRYTPLTRKEMDDALNTHHLQNYFDLFTGMFGQPGAPSYTRVTVTRKTLLMESYTVDEKGDTHLFNTMRIVRKRQHKKTSN